jgi:hypothetical protein
LAGIFKNEKKSVTNLAKTTLSCGRTYCLYSMAEDNNYIELVEEDKFGKMESSNTVWELV